MDYKYVKTQENGDATCNYDIAGTYPVKFVDFFNWVLKNINATRIEFSATNECYGNWFGNRIEVSKNTDTGECYFVRLEPIGIYEKLANKNVVECWANGGWGVMTYYCTFE